MLMKRQRGCRRWFSRDSIFFIAEPSEHGSIVGHLDFFLFVNTATSEAAIIGPEVKRAQ